ncbi:pseudouridine synthase [Alicyclobacillus vulcanalis]|uniref:Pseudouridine synthase n=1 Tax=Alicyclobacillus vulcanalis TaxID=252246 RepID=A0A1N7KKQ1_9BACL|nr:pseudouridine synthase [Alicyclobacillus vulcanalis]SIS62179.1 ribosomal large subunit pseudouridine synthase B [Alicyclobacillus vulcanalis]
MERLQKVLAHAGVASRRKCEELILAGRVSVDGEPVTELGAKVDPSRQRIAVDGVPIELEEPVVLVLNKPVAYLSTVSDPLGRRTVMELLPPVRERLYPVGRLDYDTSGLLLFTNDGTLTQRLLHPSVEIEKVYRVSVRGVVDRETRRALTEGVELEDGVTAPAKVEVLRQADGEDGVAVVHLAIHEGRNRQVRRMFEKLGLPVQRLKRIAFGPVTLGHLKTGEWRPLTKEEWVALYQAAGLTPPPYRRPVVRRDPDAGDTRRSQSAKRGPRRR